jgi:uncharacterized iron-regulated membrane protein
MKRFRTILFWSHLSAGVLASVVILVMSFTGVVLALKPQIQEWVERDVRHVAAQGGTRLTADQLLTAVAAARPTASPQGLTVDRDPAKAAAVNLGPEGTVYVDPYTGTILGPGSARTTQFFQTMTSWHRYMGATGENRPAGKSATGISNLAFLLLGISGLYLWWPASLTTQRLRGIVWFRPASTGRARDFNWHNTIGFWCLIPIVIMTASGAVISYPWASNLVYRLAGSPLPPSRVSAPAAPAVPAASAAERNAPAAGGGQDHKPSRIPAQLDRLLARAEQQVPTWSLLAMRWPTSDDGPVAFTITDGANWNSFARSNLTLESSSGEIVLWQPYEASNLGQKARGWLRYAHTGELGGLPGQLIAGLGCLGGVFLVYTGLSLAFRRLWNWALWRRLRMGARDRVGVTSRAADVVGGGVVTE